MNIGKFCTFFFFFERLHCLLTWVCASEENVSLSQLCKIVFHLTQTRCHHVILVAYMVVDLL
jgi:hypothetical protein